MKGFVITNGKNYINRIDIIHSSMFGCHFSYSDNFFSSSFTYKKDEDYENNFSFIKTINFPKDFCPIPLNEEQLQEIQEYISLKEIIE